MKQSFHGRTMATLTATGQKKFRRGMNRFSGLSYVSFNHLSELEEAVTEKTAAIMLEPIQGEGGVHVASRDYLKAVRDLCTQKDILLIFDEVQTGMGRTGTLFAYEQFVQPDVMTLAKGLVAASRSGPVSRRCLPRLHSAPARMHQCSAATCWPARQRFAVFRVLLDGRVLDQARRMGEYLSKGLSECKDCHHLVRDVRGLGLLQGMEIEIDTKAVVSDCLKGAF